MRTSVVLGLSPLPPLPPVYLNPLPDVAGIGPTAPSGTGIALPLGVTTKSGPRVELVGGGVVLGSDEVEVELVLLLLLLVPAEDCAGVLPLLDALPVL